MKKINFVNKPDTSTPINDKNLNKMQDNIEQAIHKRNYLAVRNSAVTITTTTDNEVNIIPLNIQIFKEGNKFTLQGDGTIKIGNGINRVQIGIMSNIANLTAGATYQGIFIMKNGVSINPRAHGRNNVGWIMNLCVPFIQVDVVEGDIIALGLINRLPGEISCEYPTLVIEEI